MIRKLREQDEHFDDLDFSFYIRGIIEEALDDLCEHEFNAKEIAYQYPGYNPDWCEEEFTQEDKNNKMNAISAVEDFVTEILMKNR